MYVGIDIGGTKMLAAYSPDARRLVATAKMATPKNQREAIPDIVKLIDQVAGGRQVAGIGVSAASPMDLNRGIMLTPPNLPWRNLPLLKDLTAATRCAVTVAHDADCGGLAETLLGVAQGFKRVLYITISTGIGTALILDGQIYHGQHNLEGGHITVQAHDGPTCSCGAPGHFEAVASGQAIKRRFGKPAYQITDKATWNAIAYDFAVGIASLAAMTTPDVIVLAGGVSTHYDRFKAPLARHLKEVYRFELPPIKLAKFVETAPVIGALQLAARTDQKLR